MNSIPLVRANMILPYTAFLERLGSPVEKWLEETRLSPFILEQPETLIPRHLGFSFLEKAAKREDLENLGLLVGQQTSLSELGNFGQLLCQSLTLYDALNTLQKIFPLNASGVVYWFEGESDFQAEEGSQERTWLCMQHIGSRSILCPYSAQFTFTQMLYLLSLVAGKEWQPEKICLQTRQTKAVKQSEIFRGSKLETGVGFTGICFPDRFLSLPLLTTAVAKKIDNQTAWQNLRSSAPPDNLPDSLEKAIVPLLREGYPDINIAAEITGMSIRTLQRRLNAHGLTYSRLVEKARFSQALLWLQDPTTQIVDIAVELGYSAHPHFSRAFKRWTGLSPAQFRRKVQENPDFVVNFPSDQFPV